MFARSRQFLSFVVPAVIKPLRVVWNQSIGFLFLVLVILAVPRMLSEFREFQNGGSNFVRVLLTAVFVAVMAAFAAQSFFRARRVSK